MYTKLLKQGKLLAHLGQSTRSVVLLRQACALLEITHGEGHALVHEAGRMVAMVAGVESAEE